MGCNSKTAIGAIPLHRVDKLCPRVLKIFRDNVQEVLFAATRHPDIETPGSSGIGEECMRGRSRDALYSVGCCRVGKLHLCLDIFGRKMHAAVSNTLLLALGVNPD